MDPKILITKLLKNREKDNIQKITFQKRKYH